MFEKAGAYDVSPHGKRFLMVRPVTPSQSQTTDMDSKRISEARSMLTELRSVDVLAEHI
jgi:hypothetical protein